MPRAKYPDLPSSIRAPGGRVKVVQQEEIFYEDAQCNGLWDQDQRVIYIDQTVSPEQKWRFLYHELGHVALTEGGVDDVLQRLCPNTAIYEGIIEGLCNAYAAQRMQERFG